MEPNATQQNVNQSRGFSALACIRFIIVADLCIRALKVTSIAVILYTKRNETCKVPLKLFLFVYLLITLARTITFIAKNRSFFNIQRIPEFRDNPDLALFNNFIEALLLFWYLIGFHWLQDCPECKYTNTLLYYSSALWVGLGFFMFIAPLLAIILVLMLVSLIRPKLEIMEYKGPNDIPDEVYQCTICFEHYEIGCSVKFLPCNHHFHSSCIDEWLYLKDSCPLCKKTVNALYELIEPTGYEV